MGRLTSHFVFRVISAVILVLILNADVLTVTGQCSDINYLTAVPNEINYLTSPNYPTAYPSNVDCRWVINAPSREHRILLNILDVYLEVSCSYDGIRITDGALETSDVILEICDNVNPGSITSTGSSMFIKFYSDSSVEERGFRLSYTTFQVGSFCPPNWVRREDFCYNHRSNVTKRDIAQQRCGYDASNLISIHSEEENTFISDNFSGIAQNVWIGVLYRLDFSNYSWVDQTKYSFTNWQTSHPQTSYICTAMDLRTKLWFSVRCTDQLAYICKKNIHGTTIVHKIPQSSKDSSGFNFWEVPGIIIAVIVFGTIGYGFLRHCCQAVTDCCDGCCETLGECCSCTRDCVYGMCICTCERQQASRRNASTTNSLSAQPEIDLNIQTIITEDSTSIGSSNSSAITEQPNGGGLTPSAPHLYNPRAPPPSYEDLTFDTNTADQAQSAALEVDGSHEPLPEYPPPSYEVATDSSRI